MAATVFGLPLLAAAGGYDAADKQFF